MTELSNPSGRGPIGAGNNKPVSDVGTMSLSQNRPNAPQGAVAGSVGGLTDSDRAFIREIHQAKHLDGTPLRLDELLRLRAENLRMQQEAMREFGPSSKTVAWFQQVLAAYDEEIAKAKSPLGSAINELNTVLANPGAKEKDLKKPVENVIKQMHDDAILGKEDEARNEEAWKLVRKAIDRVTGEKQSDLDDLIKKEKGSSGSIPDDAFRKSIGENVGIHRQRELTGMNDGEEGEKKRQKMMDALVEVINLVSDRRVNTLKSMIDQEKKSMGSVSDQQFQNVIAAVVGDGRQKELLGIKENSNGGWTIVLDVMRLILKRRRAAVDNLLKRQANPGSGITNDQVNQAIKDYDTIKAEARKMGIAVPEGDVTLGTPQFPKQ